MQSNKPHPHKRVRHLENVHIPLWLFKDTCWMLKLKLLGTCLIAPTLAVAFIIAWRTRKNKNLFLPNLAVAFWISANSAWMLGEFFELPFFWYSLTLFVGGIGLIGWFFILLLQKKVSLEQAS
ncbi:MAG: hypothetical protein K1X81_07825 [Bacteroidia bacterium]|nr:hypothetical protein [Bacteroidia bacterium]